MFWSVQGLVCWCDLVTCPPPPSAITLVLLSSPLNSQSMLLIFCAVAPYSHRCFCLILSFYIFYPLFCKIQEGERSYLDNCFESSFTSFQRHNRIFIIYCKFIWNDNHPPRQLSYYHTAKEEKATARDHFQPFSKLHCSLAIIFLYWLYSGEACTLVITNLHLCKLILTFIYALCAADSCWRHYIFGLPEARSQKHLDGKFFKFGKNIDLDWKMSWFDFGDQTWPFRKKHCESEMFSPVITKHCMSADTCTWM